MLYGCPLPGYNQTYAEDGLEKPVYWIEVPDKWVADHIIRRDEAERSLPEHITGTIASFVYALTLADAYNLPGIKSKTPGDWDTSQLTIELIAWVNRVVLTPYTNCFYVPKAWLLPWPDGQQTTTENPATDGSQTETESESPLDTATS